MEVELVSVGSAPGIQLPLIPLEFDPNDEQVLNFMSVFNSNSIVHHTNHHSCRVLQVCVCVCVCVCACACVCVCVCVCVCCVVLCCVVLCCVVCVCVCVIERACK